MSSERWTRVKELFHQALDTPEQERAAFLAAACAGDELLRREASAMLEGHFSDAPNLSGFADRLFPITSETIPRFMEGEILGGRYKILRLLSRGGMGEVYEAFDQELGSHIALKAIRMEIARDREVLERFKRELHIARRVTHPNVCRIYDLVQHGDDRLLSMEFVPGETLEKYLGTHGPLGADDALKVVGQLTSALQAAHDAGVIHHDLKPVNIMIAKEPSGLRVTVMDFGLSVLAQDDEHARTHADGTPNYMSPEQRAGLPVTAASDIYSLGLVMRDLIGPSPPHRWARVIARCVERGPANRYSRPSQILNSLSRHPSKTRVAWAAGTMLAAAVSMGLYVEIKPVDGAVETKVGQAPPEEIFPSRATLEAHNTADSPAIPQDRGDEAIQLMKRSQSDSQILVAAFENRTGEALFDEVRPALAHELGNSGSVRVASQSRVEDVFRLMRRPLDSKVDRQLARELSLRDGGIALLITGSIEKRGRAYSLSAHIVDPLSDRTIETSTEQFSVAGDVGGALSRLATSLRVRLGEEVPKRQSRAVEQVTTRSLAAFALFEKADAAAMRNDWANAAAFSRAAIGEDPNMVSARVWLAWALKNTNKPEWKSEIEQAVALAGTTTERERLFAEGSYLLMTSQTEKAVTTFEQLVERYPDHYFAHMNLSSLYATLGRDAESLKEIERSAGLRPNDFRTQSRTAFRIRDVNDVSAHFARRAMALVSPTQEWAAYDPNVFFMPFFHAWGPAPDMPVLNGAKAAANELDRAVAAGGAFKGSPYWEPFVARAIEANLALGRVKAAQQLMGELPAAAAPQKAAIIAYASGDIEEAKRILSSVPNSLSGLDNRSLEYALLAAKVGVPRVESILLQLPMVEGQIFPKIFAAEFATIQGKTTDATNILEQIFVESRNAPMYLLQQAAAESLARALDSRGDRERAIAVLEEMGARGVSMVAEPVVWMRNQVHLMSLYRSTGRIRQAAVLEARLRQRLSVADPDFWLVKQLQK